MTTIDRRRSAARALAAAAASAVLCGTALACASGRAPSGAATPPPAAARAAAPAELRIPVEYDTLPNGLRVVLSRDATAPIVTVAVYYNVGFRIEPRDRTGFAHLFEHLMFQGSENLGKLEFIQLVQKNGGILNGSTRFDFTNYFEIVPAHTLQTMLWAEADRMRGLDITQDNLTNQQGVVKNEVRVNVLNQPYGGFPWLDMPQYANTNWYNAHNFYGDLRDIDAANLADVRAFFRTYYTPRNAVLVVSGDFDPAQARAWVRQYFAGLPAPEPPPLPDVSEPRQTKEKRATRVDSLAPRPALAIAYHMPPRGSPEYYAMGLIDQILVQGKDSRLYQALVQRAGLTGGVSGGINFPLGNMYDYEGPMLWTASLFYDRDKSADSVLAVIDRAIEPLRAAPVDQATLDRALVKVRSAFYDDLDELFGFGRANLLASFALFDRDPEKINQIEAAYRAVTPALIQRTAVEYLRRENRTVLVVEPKPAPARPAGAGTTPERGS
jgi:zinc protease